MSDLATCWEPGTGEAVQQEGGNTVWHCPGQAQVTCSSWPSSPCTLSLTLSPQHLARLFQCYTVFLCATSGHLGVAGMTPSQSGHMLRILGSGRSCINHSSCTHMMQPEAACRNTAQHCVSGVYITTRPWPGLTQQGLDNP